MEEQEDTQLSRRERQIMDAVYRLGEATAAEVMENIPEPPGYSAVRAMLRVLEEKGRLRHRQDGARYVYLPVVSRETARRGALRHMVQTFFDGSAEQVVAALVDLSKSEMPAGALDRISKLIEDARKEGR